MKGIGIVLCVMLVGCGGGMSAKDACEKLKAGGHGTACTEDKPGGLGAAATGKFDLALEEPKGKTCQVLSFKSKDDFDTTVKAFDGAAALAGPHRYGNPAKLIFVQCNDGLAAEKGASIKKTVESL